MNRAQMHNSALFFNRGKGDFGDGAAAFGVVDQTVGHRAGVISSISVIYAFA